MSSPAKRKKYANTARATTKRTKEELPELPLEELMRAPVTRAAAMKMCMEAATKISTTLNARKQEENKETTKNEEGDGPGGEASAAGGSGEPVAMVMVNVKQEETSDSEAEGGVNIKEEEEEETSYFEAGGGFNIKEEETSDSETEAGVVVIKEEEEELLDVGYGELTVKMLLKRYEDGRKNDKTRKRLKPEERILPESEDEEIIEDDTVAAMNGENNFRKYVFPQYTAKEKLYRMHCTVIENLTYTRLEELFNTVLPELRGVKNEEVFSKRHELFKTTGLSKKAVRDLAVGPPFSSIQDSIITNLVIPRLYEGGLLALIQSSPNTIHYISNVLVPEAMVRIFAKANGIPVDLAEKEMRFEGAYDGDLPADFVAGILPDGDR